jgi:hypothetical protein
MKKYINYQNNGDGEKVKQKKNKLFNIEHLNYYTLTVQISVFIT